MNDGRLILSCALGLMVTSGVAAQDSLRVQLHGSVVDALSDAVIHEALVECLDERGTPRTITQSNSEGAYALFVNASGAIALRVAENGYHTLLDTVIIRPGESAHEHVIRLQPR